MRCHDGRLKQNSAPARRQDDARPEEREAEAPARRGTVSKAVQHERDGIVALLSDPTAEFDGNMLVAFLATFPADDRVHEAMIARASLPPEVVQRLGTLVAEDRLAALVGRHVAPEGSMARDHRRSLGSLQETTASVRSA